MDAKPAMIMSDHPLAAALRRAGGVRLVLGFFAMCVGSALLAERLIGAHGFLPLRSNETAGAGGVGVAFAFIWAYFTGGRLARGQSWSRALVQALLSAGVLIVLIIVIWRALGR